MPVLSLRIATSDIENDQAEALRASVEFAMRTAGVAARRAYTPCQIAVSVSAGVSMYRAALCLLSHL